MRFGLLRERRNVMCVSKKAVLPWVSHEGNTGMRVLTFLRGKAILSRENIRMRSVVFD
jgi:hypothetical protein